jgi:predicted benzoate:H+ symporter BenE
MDQGGLICFLVIISGVFLFLYGANYYDAVVGWAGLGLLVGGIVAYVIQGWYKAHTESVEHPNP